MFLPFVWTFPPESPPPVLFSTLCETLSLMGEPRRNCGPGPKRWPTWNCNIWMIWGDMWLPALSHHYPCLWVCCRGECYDAKAVEQGQWQDKFIERKHSIQVQQHQDGKVEAGDWTGPGEKEMFVAFFLPGESWLSCGAAWCWATGWLATNWQQAVGRTKARPRRASSRLSYLPWTTASAGCWMLSIILYHCQIYTLQVLVGNCLM